MISDLSWNGAILPHMKSVDGGVERLGCWHVRMQPAARVLRQRLHWPGAAAAALLAVATLAGCGVLVADEASRPPPPGLVEPVLEPLDVPFAHRWASDTSHPLLAAAAIDIDGDGRDEVFLGGSDGQPDALIAWRDGKLVDIAAQMGIGGTTATYGALSLDFDGDGRVDLLTAGHAGLVLWLNRAAGFTRQLLAVDAVPMAVSEGLQNTFTASFVDLDQVGNLKRSPGRHVLVRLPDIPASIGESASRACTRRCVTSLPAKV